MAPKNYILLKMYQCAESAEKWVDKNVPNQIRNNSPTSSAFYKMPGIAKAAIAELDNTILSFTRNPMLLLFTILLIKYYPSYFSGFLCRRGYAESFFIKTSPPQFQRDDLEWAYRNPILCR
jgi:hypothetical protein